MIWATVSSWSCFCWLYRASPSLAAKNIINLISVLTICRSIHIVTNGIFILFYGWVIFHCIYAPHLYPFFCWCFHVLAVVNSAAVNFGMDVSFPVRVFSRYMPRSEISGSYSDSNFSVLRTLLTVLTIVAAPIYILINSTGEFPFLYTLFSIYYL